MKKPAIIFIFTSIIYLGLTAQPMPTVIKTQAIEMGKALVNNDLPGFQQYMHPEIIKQAGGAEKMKVMADSAISLLRKFGGAITRISYGNPAIILTHKKELQTTLPQTTFITTAFADIELESTLVAISQDKGKHWYFIDTQLYGSDNLRQKLPALSPELVIPAPQKPRMIPKEQ
jgi:hypothetical protein